MEQRSAIADSQKTHIRSLNFFRIFGALIIFLTHLRLEHGVEGTVGLDLFFVLSGFVICSGYSDKIAQQNVSLRVFMKKRIGKIYPVYALMTFVGLVYMIWICGFSTTSTLLKLPGHLFFLQPFISGYFSAFNGAGWYVAALMWLYLFFYFFQPGKKTFWMMGIWTILLIIASIFTPQWPYFDWEHSPTTVVSYFYMGVFSAYLYKNKKLCLSKTLFSVFEVIFFVALVLLAFYFPPRFFSPMNFLLCAAVAVAYYIFAHENGILSRLFCSRIVAVVASYTFYFYMAHYLVIQYAVHIFSIEWTGFWASVSLFFVSVICAMGLKLFDGYIQTNLITRRK